MPLFRLNIVLSLFNRVNRFFFKEKSKALLSAKKEKKREEKKEKKLKKKSLPVIECQSPSLSGGGAWR